MPLIILLLFIAVPVVEIGLFIKVGGWLGVWTTIGIVVLTAVIGTALLRHQGLGTVRRIQQSLARDEMPVAELFDGACLLFAGALLLTPGFMSDAFGFLLFLPPFRAAIARAAGGYILRHGQVHVSTMHAGAGPGSRGDGGFNAGGYGAGGHEPGGRNADGVIDGEYEDVTPETKKVPGNRESGQDK